MPLRRATLRPRPTKNDEAAVDHTDEKAYGKRGGDCHADRPAVVDVQDGECHAGQPRRGGHREVVVAGRQRRQQRECHHHENRLRAEDRREVRGREERVGPEHREHDHDDPPDG
jgi:hypothetical protein